MYDALKDLIIKKSITRAEGNLCFAEIINKFVLGKSFRFFINVIAYFLAKPY